MSQAQSGVEAAFAQLLSALEAEKVDFQKLGGEIFHGGAPKEAQYLLRRAQANIDLRKAVVALCEKWKAGQPANSAAPAPEQPSAETNKTSGPGLIRNIEGVSMAEAAQAIGVTPAKVKAWLEDGTLKGYQRVSGTWKIARTDLIDFVRNRRS